MGSELMIRDLHVQVEDKGILKGVDLAVRQGEIHAMMGPNGSGKSTLAYALMGHPKYTVTQGEVLLDGQNIVDWGPDERSRHGLFLAFQYPTAIPGVSVANFLRMAIKAHEGNGRGRKSMSPMEFRKLLTDKMALLEMDRSFAGRYLNEGFSGGEKKRAEILQMAVLEPKFAVLDETDSGLDIDALKIVSRGVNTLAGPNMGVLVITHYQRILRYIKPDFVHIFMDGNIVMSGGRDLADKLEAQGYDWVRAEVEDAT